MNNVVVTIAIAIVILLISLTIETYLLNFILEIGLAKSAASVLFLNDILHKLKMGKA